MNELGATYHVLSVSRHVNTECRAGEIDLTNQLHAAVEDHYLRPVMELGTPGSESHHCAVVVGFGANGRALIHAGAGHRVGTDHLGAGNVEQNDLAREPVIRIIPGKRTHGRAVVRDYGRPAEPAIRKTEVNHSLVGGAVKLVDVEVEAVDDKHTAIAGNPVKDVTGTGAGDTEDRITIGGIYQDREIILRDKGHGTVIHQIDSIHPESVRPRRSNHAGVSLKDIER